jgi:hypothetical protein
MSLLLRRFPYVTMGPSLENAQPKYTSQLRPISHAHVQRAPVDLDLSFLEQRLISDG